MLGQLHCNEFSGVSRRVEEIREATAVDRNFTEASGSDAMVSSVVDPWDGNFAKPDTPLDLVDLERPIQASQISSARMQVQVGRRFGISEVKRV